MDFVCLEQRLVLEVDGAQHAEQLDYDTARDDWLRADGYRVLRFSDREVLMEADSVAQAIWQALEATTPLPNPPPQGGRVTPPPTHSASEGPEPASMSDPGDVVITVDVAA